jgi:hypothetical protein
MTGQGYISHYGGQDRLPKSDVRPDSRNDLAGVATHKPYVAFHPFLIISIFTLLGSSFQHIGPALAKKLSQRMFPYNTDLGTLSL